MAKNNRHIHKPCLWLLILALAVVFVLNACIGGSSTDTENSPRIVGVDYHPGNSVKDEISIKTDGSLFLANVPGDGISFELPLGKTVVTYTESHLVDTLPKALFSQAIVFSDSNVFSEVETKEVTTTVLNKSLVVRVLTPDSMLIHGIPVSIRPVEYIPEESASWTVEAATDSIGLAVFQGLSARSYVIQGGGHSTIEFWGKVVNYEPKGIRVYKMIQAPKQIISGTVRRISGTNPINTTVFLQGTSVRTTTDSLGNYNFGYLPVENIPPIGFLLPNRVMIVQDTVNSKTLYCTVDAETMLTLENGRAKLENTVYTLVDTTAAVCTPN